MDEELKIITRSYAPKLDEAFIYASWRNAAYFGAYDKVRESASIFFSNKSREIKKILENATIKIACLEDSPQTIIGYSVCEGNHLNFVYVKPSYRLQGIAKILVPSTIKSYTTDLTKIGQKILEKKQKEEMCLPREKK